MIDPTKVALAMSGGLSAVCAVCENYWIARDKNLPDGKCLSVNNCGSPISGDTFHEYKGPMTQFDSFCFACGNKSTHALRVSGHVRVIGACAVHVDLVKRLKPEGKRAADVIVISKDGQLKVSEKDVIKTSSTLKFT
jgi:hypothetical protein